ncbi:MAG: DUF2232 domain-containing protein [Bdellovibrionota bacterium]
MDKPPLESGWIDHSEESERSGSWSFPLALCLLSSVLYVLGPFAVLAPLPLVYLHVGTPIARRGRVWALIGLLIGVALTTSVHGIWWGGLCFFLFTSLPALVLSEMLIRRISPERAVVGAMLAAILGATIAAWGLTRAHGMQFLPGVAETTVKTVKELEDYGVTFRKMVAANAPPETTSSDDQEDEAAAAKIEDPREIAKTLPGFGLSVLLFLCSLPCIVMIRWNPKGFLRRTGIGRDFLRRWRTSDWFIWPALLTGLFLLVDVPPLTIVAKNLTYPILLIYFFQGMSILAYFLDSLRLRGPIRVIYYGTAILFLPLMVVSFGFFDFWIRFRSRSRLQGKDKEDLV